MAVVVLKMVDRKAQVQVPEASSMRKAHQEMQSMYNVKLLLEIHIQGPDDHNPLVPNVVIAMLKKQIHGQK